ncbi:MAG: phosphoribosylformylglycinamidine synthase I [Candidatus Glassbacteria bacterium]|nr:phosphoribosylformylglycinamidine synthase I [Candidatus Glassbacteria bacterium]
MVLTGFGINCDYETQYAFFKAGSVARRVHVNDLIERPGLLAEYQILALPGGFSFGDDIASGKVLANKMRYRLGRALESFLEAGGLVIGICNGFQVLVRLGLLPDGRSGLGRQRVSLTYNDSGKFEDRWVHLEAENRMDCVFTRGIDRLELPVRHGEGKFVADTEETLEELERSGQVVLRYCTPGGGQPEYPENPNGSVNAVAGICDLTGRVFGLMPHPEAFLHRSQHPRWTRQKLVEQGQGMAIFRNAVAYFE